MYTRRDSYLRELSMPLARTMTDMEELAWKLNQLKPHAPTSSDDTYRTRMGSQRGTMPVFPRRSKVARQPLPRYAFTQLRDLVYRRDAGQCQYCGSDVGYAECNIDHVVPWDAGGRSEASNLVVACKDCNKAKGRALIPFDLRPI